MQKFNITKEYLKQEYVIKKQQMQHIAEELGCSIAYISKLVKKYKLKTKTEDTYIGKKFGRLVPLRLDSKIGSHLVFDCLCDCGKTIKVRGYSLKTKNTNSCGCTSRKRGKDHPCFKGYEGLTSSVWSSLIKGAKERNLEFSITMQQAWELFEKQGKRCALTGEVIVMTQTRKNMSKRTASLDRIDSSKGYTIDNIQWIHKRLNFMKQDMDQTEFIELCKKVANYN